jgi:hypothetical protein
MYAYIFFKRNFAFIPNAETEMVNKIVEFSSAMIHPIVRVNSIVFIHHESFKSHVIMKRSLICNDENIRCTVNVSPV